MAQDKDAGYRDPEIGSLEEQFEGRKLGRDAFIQALGGEEQEPVIDTPIRSSAISHARYDPGSETLTLTFRKGLQRSYVLRGVGPSTVERFLRSPSKGRFFQDELRGQY